MKIRKHFFTLIFLLSTLIVFGQKNEYNVIPQPVQLKPDAGQFTFNNQTSLFLDKGVNKEVSNAFFILAEHLKTAGGIDLQTTTTGKANGIVCKINNQLPKSESYKLQIEKDKIIVEAREPIGFFYAAQTLRQLLPSEIESQTKQANVKWTVPCCQIEDTPQYAYRGMHLDVCRNFSPKEEVMLYIDQLAFLKLNTFHWHLTDDQGWRIEIKKYPRLTEVGGFRNRTVIGHYNDKPRRWDDTRVGGFYTQEEIKEVIAYAQKRFINIIPEIELPGHAVAALTAYPQFSCSGGPFQVEGLWGIFNDVYCTREETFGFLEDILDEVADLFPSEYIHIGGDECPKLRWERCNACQERMKAEGLKNEHELQSYFVNRIGKFLSTKGKKFIGWDEILEGGNLAHDAIVMSWRGTEGGIAAARLGHDVIMTPSAAVYLDYYQSQLPSEPLAIGGYVPIQTVYNFNPTPAELTPAEAKHIWGVQANVWTEYMPNANQRQYMIFPRIAALAENAWLPAEKKNYTDFEHRLPSLLKHYNVMGINYSKAFYNITGAPSIQKGKLELALQTADPKAKIHYTTDGSPANTQSPLYTTPGVLGKTPVTLNAIPVENGGILSAPYSQSFIVNKAAGQKVTLSTEPTEKYKGKGVLTLTDCILARYPLMGSEWLGFLGKDVDVLIEFEQPVSVHKLTTGSAEHPGQWIYAPKEVEYFISENGTAFQSIGKLEREDMLKNDSKAILEIPAVEIKKLKVAVKNYGIIPEGEQGAGNGSWLFLDEIVVE
ncbi:MAG: family 20 glycosylhydrolase [Candidatus Symbiothrix sp.]|jgi:hexosaminidase|nr:family 20 glycosylhydrolase [Candidatus Symbiothrix sp.]